ncbi:MAG: isochorismatase family protein [Acidimicrobiia bacterium]|nr:isochorismatase family protein [Acidimicrobiia bacterium]
MSVIELEDRSAYRQSLNEALTIDPSRTAVVTIDMQREYLDETVGQSVVVASEAERMLSANKAFLDQCRDLNIPVVHAYVVRRTEEVESGFHSGGLAYTMTAQSLGVSQMPHRPARSHPDRVLGTPASEVPAELAAPGDIHVTSKKSLDSFLDTDLGFLLRRILKVKYLLMCGINTDTCVYSTTLTAANQGYWPIVVSDCVASMRGIDSHRMALELMSRSIAWVMPGTEVIARLQD